MNGDLRRPERWFLRELKLIDYRFDVGWVPKIQRWMVYFNSEPSHLVALGNQTDAVGKIKKIGEYMPLDQRTLRKVKVDYYLSVNPKALDRWLDEDDPYLLQAYISRGVQGVKDYLAGF